MEPEQFAVMFRREERHWWYAGMRRTALAVLNHALAGQTALRILDAGCGTGGTTVHLRRFGAVVGLDLAWEALLPAAERGLNGHLVRGTVEHLPFADATFDAVTSFEVVYHLGVNDDRRALAELRRVLRPGGVLLLRLPAHDWLRGAHDRLVHTRHRYSRAEVADKLRGSGFRVERLNWANSALFLPAAIKRLLEPRPPKIGERKSARVDEGVVHPQTPDLWQPPGPLNALLEGIVGMEALAVPRGVPLPFGLSVIALARAA
jgi:SAM-dependent methyltransferase